MDIIMETVVVLSFSLTALHLLHDFATSLVHIKVSNPLLLLPSFIRLILC